MDENPGAALARDGLPGLRPAAGGWRRGPGSSGRPARVRQGRGARCRGPRDRAARAIPVFMTMVRLAGDSVFIARVRRADPGRGSRLWTSGPTRSERDRCRRRWPRRARSRFRPACRPGMNHPRRARLVRVAGCGEQRRKMLSNLHPGLFGRKNLSQPRRARMLAWNPNPSFWPRTMVRTRSSYEPSAPLPARRDSERFTTAVERAM